MKLRSILSSLLVVTLAVAGCGDSSSSSSSAPKGDRKQIAVIAKSTTNSYWKAVEAGAKQAGAELNVDILWDGPTAETDHTGQAQLVDNMLNRGIDGIVLAPTSVAAKKPLENAAAKKVPVVIVDSDAGSENYVSFVATDNYAAGKQAAEALVKAIGANKPNGGQVIMLRFLEGSGSTEAREKGFTDGIEAAGMKVVESVYVKGTGSPTDANESADALLRRFTQDGALKVDGVFASNQPTAIGMLRKLQDLKSAGTKIDAPFVGFDAHEILLKGIREGSVAAVVTQDPKTMGYEGVKTIVAHLKGEKVDRKIATATATVTKDNIDDPKIKAVTGE